MLDTTLGYDRLVECFVNIDMNKILLYVEFSIGHATVAHALGKK